MQYVPAKRAFLKGRFDQPDHIRPPGAVGGFVDACTQCGDCATACPSEIIYRDADGFPVINLLAGECLLCSGCADACEAGAILPAVSWDIRATVADSCLSMNAVTCRTCEDQCDARAIRFQLQSGGRSTPLIDPETCTGCGACAAPCPVGAIQFYQRQPQPKETPC